MRDQSLVIWVAIMLHFFQGIVVLWSDAANGTTDINTLLTVFPNHVVLGLVLIAVACEAAWGLVRQHKSRLAVLIHLLPQQAILVMVGAGAIYFIAAGHYADGVIRSSAFIFADQFGRVCLMVAHTLAIFQKVYYG